jgi:LuxR family transcriptional regulator, maltose regulon positive regulatory protein
VLVATKLHAPELQRGLVSRRELVDRLLADDGRRLTLVCAPPGWGKTVLPSEWHARPEETRPFAWVSLDEGDDDPVKPRLCTGAESRHSRTCSAADTPTSRRL